MNSQPVTALERFYPVDWDPGTSLVLHVFDDYDTCLRRIRPHVLYLAQFKEKNPDIITKALTLRLKTLLDQLNAARLRRVSNSRNFLTRRGHRTARELFKEIRSIRMEFDELAIKRVVEVIKNKNIVMNQLAQGDTVRTEPGAEVRVPEDPSKWDANEDARIISIMRKSADDVQAALIWIRDALAIFRHSVSDEQAELLLTLHTEWRESVSKSATWFKWLPMPLRRGHAGNLRGRVMALKWNIARNEDQFLQLEKERRAQYVQGLEAAAEGIVGVLVEE